jgi:hypothetical protein
MKLIDLIATKEFIDVPNGGVVHYETDAVTDGPAIILSNNPTGTYTMALVNTFHSEGPVKVLMKGIAQVGNKKYKVGDVIGKLLVL